MCLIFIRFMCNIHIYSALCWFLFVGTGFEFPGNIILKGKNHENQDLFNHHLALPKLHLFN